MADFVDGNAYNHEQGQRARKLFAAVVLAIIAPPHVPFVRAPAATPLLLALVLLLRPKGLFGEER